MIEDNDFVSNASPRMQNPVVISSLIPVPVPVRVQMRVPQTLEGDQSEIELSHDGESSATVREARVRT